MLAKKERDYPRLSASGDLQARLRKQIEDLEKAALGESKRAKIILFATQVDEMLKELLTKFLKPPRAKDKDDMFGPFAPLSTFAARTALGFRLGLISKDDADAFDILRKIRNDCAHKIFEFDLTKSPYCDHLKRFVTLTTQDPSRAFAVNKVAHAETDQERFVYCCLTHIAYLHETMASVTQCPDVFTTDYFLLKRKANERELRRLKARASATSEKPGFHQGR